MLKTAVGTSLDIQLSHFLPYFQPIVGVASGRIEGYELLARRMTADGNIVSAGGFFTDDQTADDDKLSVDRHLRSQAFKQFCESTEAGFLSINILPAWIMRLAEGVVSPTLEMLEKIGLPPERVVVEITESHGDLERLQNLVKQYRQAGVRVAIDDFGARESQIDRVIALEPDWIKLDMQLFQRAARGHASSDILLGMMSLAQRAGSTVVCEGVETDSDFYFGLECGAQMMQGFRFSAANSHFLPPAAAQVSIQSLLQQFRTLKTARLHRTIDRTQSLKIAIQHLRKLLLSGKATEVDTAELYANGALRFFLCDKQGIQISPNYELSPSGIQTDPSYQGYNWSWRPYFPTLLAMEHRPQSDLVASGAYRDANNRKLCKTFGVFLDSDRILLIDAQVDDDVLIGNTN